MKKILLTLFACVASTALFAATISIAGVYYTTNSNGTATVARQDSHWNPSGDIVIPEEIEDENGQTYTVTGFDVMAFCGTNIVSISVPSTITSWGMFCISSNNLLKTITFGDGLTSIGANAIQQNSALESVDLSNTIVESVGNQFLYDCGSLSSVVLPSTLTNIGYMSFADCTSLMSITCLAKTPPTINSNNAFTNVPSTCVLYVPAGCKDAYAAATCWKNFIIEEIFILEDGAKFEYDGLFYEIVSLEEKTVEVTWGGESSTSGTDSYVGNITIPETATYDEDTFAVVGIGEYAFYACELTSIDLPDNVAEIGNSAFSDCTSLVEIYSYNPVPPTCGTDVFNNVDVNTCTLYIPEGTYDAYNSDEVWSIFLNKVEMTEFSIETLAATDVSDTSATLNGSITAAYDDPVTMKGFAYYSDPDVVRSVTITDDEMTYTLKNLTPGTTYTYYAFATLASGPTIYGDKVEFTTASPDGISNIYADSDNVVGIYSTSGQKLSTTQPGVNIVKYNDGTVKKIYVK